MKRILLASIILLSSASLLMYGCGRKSNNDPLFQDTDGDGITDALDPDIDGDGVPNDEDCYPYDPLLDCSEDDDEENIDEECRDDGDWITIIDYGDVGGEDGEGTEDPIDPESSIDLSDCIVSRTYDEEIRVKIEYCVHWRDAVLVSGDTVSIKSFANTQYGYIGAFAGLHDGSAYTGRPNYACADFDNGKFDNKAHVTITYSDGATKDFVWKYPAFAPLSLGLRNLDPSSPTELNEFRQLRGRANIRYDNVNNNFGPGHRMHIITIDDWRYGPRIYGFEFVYKYDIKEEGYYE